MSYVDHLREQYKAAKGRLGLLAPAVPSVPRSIITAQPFARDMAPIKPKSVPRRHRAPAPVVRIMKNEQPKPETITAPPPAPPQTPEPAADGEQITPTFTVRKIIDATAAAAWCSPAEILGHRRSRQVTRWRHVAIYLSVTLRPDLTYPSIGNVFKRDHSTIMYGHEKVAKRIHDYGPEITAVMELLQ